jgi:adenine C2-methylase RlmN of 23S rRNA A2503 and tRNA A37
MKTYRSNDGRVTKFLHDDGSETCIKTVYSVDTVPNPTTGELEAVSVDRNKYSVFISVSRGCPINCSFCYLTIDDVPYGKLRTETIINNIKQSIEAEADRSNLKDRYIKLCWMGMGDAGMNPRLVHDVTYEIMEWVMEKGYAKGLDGVDISTVHPTAPINSVSVLGALNGLLSYYPLNPNNKNVVNREQGTLVAYKDRSRLRVFFSLHSAIQKTRDKIIPKVSALSSAIVQFQMLQHTGIDVIIHHMFLDGINDTEEEVQAVIDFMEKHFPNNELRILRYNKHEDSPIKESDVVEKCICMLYSAGLNKVKVQVSYGLEVKSACGQFIYNNTNNVEQFEEA